MPLLSVVVITYNHEKYIFDCLNGIFTQQVDFEVEVIIGDDCSTDTTQEIILNYLKSNPVSDRFQVILNFQPKNLSSPPNIPGKLNFMSALEKATGKYIALCEGDDYWTDPLKLQKQVDFLERNPGYVLTHHSIAEVDADGTNKKEVLKQNNQLKTQTQSIIIKNSIHTCSVVFRNVLTPLPNWFQKVTAGDRVMWILLSQMGNFYAFEEVMGCYRLHSSSTWSSNSGMKTLKNSLRNSFVLNRSLKNKYAFYFFQSVIQDIYDALFKIRAEKKYLTYIFFLLLLTMFLPFAKNFSFKNLWNHGKFIFISLIDQK